jgi:hypothetical protein
VTRAAAALAAALSTLALWPARGAGQALLTQPQRYLLTTDVFDGRALWVQPAGLARRREASVGWSITGERRGSALALEQYGLTLASGGFGLGWQRSELIDNTHVSQWAIGYGAGGPRASIGAARRWLRGDRVHDAVWDVGVRVVPRPLLEVSVVWRDIGSPTVRAPAGVPSPQDTTYEATLLSAAALTLLGGRARLGGEWELVTAGWGTSAVRAGAAVVLPFNLGLQVRAEFAGDFAYRALAVALTWSAAATRITGFGAFPQGGGTRQYGVWGSAVRDLEPRSPGFR